MVFSLDSGSVTLAAANATKAAMGTAKLINGFYNPSNSGKNAVVIRAIISTVSGTPAGPFFYNYLSIGTSSTVGAVSSVVITNSASGSIGSNLLLNNPGAPTSSLMVPEVNVTLTATGAITTNLNQLSVIGGPAAIASGAGDYHVEDNPELAYSRESLIIVPPGTVFGIMGTGAGTSHVVQSTIWWTEEGRSTWQ